MHSPPVSKTMAEALAADFAALQGPFSIILADPPYQYDGQTTTPSRFIEKQYPTMSLDDICALPVASKSARDALLFLWSPAPKLLDALDIMALWGFDHRTAMVWVKDRIGLGHYVRQQSEILLIGRRGKMRAPLYANRPSSVIKAPRGKHSAKPPQVYDIIERMYPGPEVRRLELFARTQRPGWTAWGLDVLLGSAETVVPNGSTSRTPGAPALQPPLPLPPVEENATAS